MSRRIWWAIRLGDYGRNEIVCCEPNPRCIPPKIHYQERLSYTIKYANTNKLSRERLSYIIKYANINKWQVLNIKYKKNKKINTQTVKRIQEGKTIRKRTGWNHRGNERFWGSAGGLDRTTEEMRNSKGQTEKSVGSLSNKFDQAQEKKSQSLKKGLLLVRNRKKKGEVENHKEKMKELWDTAKKSNI